MWPKLSVDGFGWRKDKFKFDEKFIKSHEKGSDEERDMHEVHVKYPKGLHKLNSDLPLLPNKMNIDKCEKLVSSL